MTERPILFSAPMVRAILEGRKKCTRRVIDCTGVVGSTHRLDASDGNRYFFKSRFAVGDTLWVREAWRADSSHDRTRPSDLDDMTVQISYEADELIGENGKLRPSMFMPRWMSRTTLRVTSIKVERLNDISEADARAEGIERLKSGRGYYHPLHGHGHVHIEYCDTAKLAFEILWESINGADSWKANPWVVAIGFEVVT